MTNGTTGLRRWSDAAGPLVVGAALLFAASFLLRYPGQVSFDAAKQYAQAVSGHYDDWHPPVMARLWSVLASVAPPAPAMLAFQLLGHWVGIALFADGLRRAGRAGAAWVMLASGASPLFLYYEGLIYKDVGLASVLLAASGIGFWYKVQARCIARPALAAALLLVGYGVLVRANAVFAFGPVLLYLLWSPARLSAVRVVGVSVLLAVVAVPVSGFVNRHLLGAAPSGVTQSLELFDLAGIAHESGDLSVLPAGVAFTRSDLAICYTPRFWDSLNSVACRNAFTHLPPPGSPARDAVGGLWLRAIATHPVAYARHRLKAYNSLLNWLVPAQQCRFAPFDASCGTPNPRTGRMIWTADSPRFVRSDYLKKNVLVWPVTWLAVGVALGVLAWRGARDPDHRRGADAARFRAALRARLSGRGGGRGPALFLLADRRDPEQRDPVLGRAARPRAGPDGLGRRGADLRRDRGRLSRAPRRPSGVRHLTPPPGGFPPGEGSATAAAFRPPSPGGRSISCAAWLVSSAPAGDRRRCWAEWRG